MTNLSLREVYKESLKFISWRNGLEMVIAKGGQNRKANPCKARIYVREIQWKATSIYIIENNFIYIKDDKPITNMLLIRIINIVSFIYLFL
uniref:Uncharacterized protein n=1 Tax=Octopus bimaculoides TaxID=37653 RepID=A0A0L8G835_OCTBM